MSPDLIEVALLEEGASYGLMEIVLNELGDFVAEMDAPRAGTTRRFPYTLGGIEAPPLWVILLAYIMKPVVEYWQHRGFGIPAASERYIAHMIWADSIIVFSQGQAQQTTILRSVPIYRTRLRCNASSLEFLRGVPGPRGVIA